MVLLTILILHKIFEKDKYVNIAIAIEGVYHLATILAVEF